MRTQNPCPYCGAKSGQLCHGYGLREGDVHDARDGSKIKPTDVIEIGRARAMLGCGSSMSLVDGVRRVTSAMKEQVEEIERLRSTVAELTAQLDAEEREREAQR